MDDWDITFAGLRRTFIDRASAIADEASRALDHLTRENSSREALDTLRNSFHKLVGSGATYGFNTIADAAAEAELVCRAHLDGMTQPQGSEIDAWRNSVKTIRALVDEARSRPDAASSVPAPNDGAMPHSST